MMCLNMLVTIIWAIIGVISYAIARDNSIFLQWSFFLSLIITWFIYGGAAPKKSDLAVLSMIVLASGGTAFPILSKALWQ